MQQLLVTILSAKEFNLAVRTAKVTPEQREYISERYFQGRYFLENTEWKDSKYDALPEMSKIELSDFCGTLEITPVKMLPTFAEMAMNSEVPSLPPRAQRYDRAMERLEKLRWCNAIKGFESRRNETFSMLQGEIINYTHPAPHNTTDENLEKLVTRIEKSVEKYASFTENKSK